MMGQQGNLYYDGTCQTHDSSCPSNTTYNILNNYAAVYLLQSSPSLLCPYYNGQIYSDPSGQQWQVYCGYANSGATAASTTRAASKLTKRERKEDHLLFCC